VNVLEVRDAWKSYGDVPALAGAALELREGELLGLLGPNGAGKTTLVRAAAGRVRLDRGSVELSGGRERLGLVPQEIAVYPLLTAAENLSAFGSLHGLTGGELKERVRWALDWTGLVERSKEPVKSFSGGMKRRLNIACGVLHRPAVVLLDEPTVGVDPQSRERIYQMLDGLRADGASLLLTTHYLEEVEARCDRVVIIDHGRSVAEGTPAELVARIIGPERLVRLTLDRPAPVIPEGLTAEPGNRVLCASVGDVAELPGLIERVRAAGLVVGDLEVRSPSLQAVFLHLTGKDLRE
jgi:ABC-2 type transport system ATP-binding protein